MYELLFYFNTAGTSESRRILEASMKQGYVNAFIDKMLFHGSAGVGKTCTQKIVAGEDPPCQMSGLAHL